jgi:hypothetical protein
MLVVLRETEDLRCQHQDVHLLAESLSNWPFQRYAQARQLKGVRLKCLPVKCRRRDIHMLNKPVLVAPQR